MKTGIGKKGFTLLEVIIVIIIIGVLASLGLPRLFAVIEGSRAAEALVSIASIRSAMERCYLMRDGDYGGCQMNTIDIEDPADAPNAHFSYSIISIPNQGYWLFAVRKSLDGGDTSEFIFLGHNFEYDGGVNYTNDNDLHWYASGAYKGSVPK